MRSVELFSGAGGMAMGATLAGFRPEAVIEWDKRACDTVRENQNRQNPLVADWPLHEMDVRQFDFSDILGEIDLLAGGPPCQPFSLGGKHKANSDNRDMFPTTINIVRQLHPKSFLIENVKGLTRCSFSNYLQYTILQLTFPCLTIVDNESWIEHLARLEKEKTSGRSDEFTYDVVYRVVNAADYGVPQCRERVFIVGFRHDLGIRWAFPKPTHSLESLLHSQLISGEYWDRHEISSSQRAKINLKPKVDVERIKFLHQTTNDKPWLTVRDGLLGLTDPCDDRSSIVFNNHDYQPGAQIYVGHTGSHLDWPAKTLKAGNHGVPGGENMLVTSSGRARYFTVRESARIQTFPDTYVFPGSWTESMRQLGNAVPVVLAKTMAASIAEKLIETKFNKLLKN
ncbi:MAG: DNA cytosine methyltransferase [Deltaproteobacteria bacterium]|nr:DNA cytosine methyltransferase [Deltaproteobacteria bacterium]